MQVIPLTALHAHPKNPRLAPRDDVVEQIAAQLNGKLDEAHALIVRPNASGYEIISGHHRKLAAERAGLKEVPCWVRDMSDEDAYMALALCNAQGELNALERGFHALGATEKGKWNKSVSAYATAVGKADTTVRREVQAAEVAKSAHVGELSDLIDFTRHLSEIHAAPRWLWHVLVAAMLDKEWPVVAIHKTVKALAGAADPPYWADAETIADRLVSGAMKPGDVAKLQATVNATKEKLTAEGLADELDAALAKAKPAMLSQVAALCNSVSDKQAEIDRAARDAEAKEQQAKEEAEARASRLREHVSLDEWKTLDDATKQSLLAFSAKSGPTFNKQENADIEWAQYSWNPITGCLHDCVYCYARDIALSKRTEKVFPFGFEPTLHPLRLLAPHGTKPPKEAAHDTRYRNVFTGSMADIFGRWVPAEWIEAVLAQVKSSPQWNFLFLTKFPNRMAEFDIPSNAWLGTSVDLQVRVAAAEKAFAKVKAPVKWLSIEPMLEPLTFKRLDLFDWVVIGGASRSTKTPEWRPPFAWIYDLVKQAREANVKVYFKTNLLGNPSRLLELPFDAPIPAEEAELPEIFRYLGKSKNQNASPEAA